MSTATLVARLSDLHQMPQRKTALLLMGGGARTAYQAGVLRGIAKILELQRAVPPLNPFQIIVGTSAGSINAAFLACRALKWRQAIDDMAALWLALHVPDVYEHDMPRLAASGNRWLSMIGLGSHLRGRVREGLHALLDATPLRDTLSRAMDFPQLDRAIDAGVLHALGVTASSYTSGDHITFVQGAEAVKTWQRPGRRALKQAITIDHLLASSAIPFIFAPVPLFLDEHVEYFGDGSMRQLSPLSPTIHLGASKILAIGVGRAVDAPGSPLPAGSTQMMYAPHDTAVYAPLPGLREIGAATQGGAPLPAAADAPGEAADAPGAAPHEDFAVGQMPSLAQVAGHAMATVFLDTLRSDVEQTLRLNDALRRLPADVAERLAFRPIEVLMFLPSQPIESLATAFVERAPKPVRGMLRALGAGEKSGAGLASYLLFEPDFIGALVALGESDAFARKDEVRQFFDLG
jgi:NTE family protein